MSKMKLLTKTNIRVGAVLRSLDGTTHTIGSCNGLPFIHDKGRLIYLTDLSEKELTKYIIVQEASNDKHAETPEKDSKYG